MCIPFTFRRSTSPLYQLAKHYQNRPSVSSLFLQSAAVLLTQSYLSCLGGMELWLSFTSWIMDQLRPWPSTSVPSAIAQLLIHGWRLARTLAIATMSTHGPSSCQLLPAMNCCPSSDWLFVDYCCRTTKLYKTLWTIPLHSLGTTNFVTITLNLQDTRATRGQWLSRCGEARSITSLYAHFQATITSSAGSGTYDVDIIQNMVTSPQAFTVDIDFTAN
jgi:hypothetical protein